MNIFEDLNTQQEEAVRKVGSPLLVLAGAGSGKTRVLSAKTSHLVADHKVKPESIALLTFTNKAALEMKERVAKHENIRSPLGFAGTFHTLGARILRRYGHTIGLDNNFVIYDTSDQESLVKKIVKELGWDTKTNRPGMYLNLISRMKGDLKNIEDFKNSIKDEFGDKLATVWGKYEFELTKANAVDFDDLLLKVLLLPALPSYEFILVDEYQDTNKAQYQITKRLAGNGNGLTVVGDASQAIYSFRGADHRNITLLVNDYPNLTTIELPINYRSSQTILDSAYGVIKRNTSHPVVKLIADKPLGEKVKIVDLIDEREESWFVTDRAIEARTNGKTMAVLYRTNAQSRSIEESLVKMGVPYRLYGGVRFYDRMEIKDILAMLRVFVNRNDSVSWNRIEGLGKKLAVSYRNWIESNLARLEKLTPTELIEEVLLQTSYKERFNVKIEEDLGRLENIAELSSVSSEYENVLEMLTNASLMQSTDDQGDKNLPGLILMTIHSAKGSEFDVVIVVGLEEGILPHSRSMLDAKELEEERRLMYVAMTRAREQLFLTTCRSRMIYGMRGNGIPSRFLADIPRELIDFLGKQSKDSWRNSDGEVSKRRIVSDWEVDEATKDDFAEIDAW